ncbi:hypothetical protein SSX86_016236 [Deinandra increscens subsp. villosa]|uniref:Uncharacterized protein n=1 Tax=Deinandra increscens subsp. villosa TaxID=3103831 RepID=A0AAP0D4X5_9ASTR
MAATITAAYLPPENHPAKIRGKRISVTLYGKYAYKASEYVNANKHEHHFITILQFAKFENWKGRHSVNNGFDASNLFINDHEIEETTSFLHSFVQQLQDQSSSSFSHCCSSLTYNIHDDFVNVTKLIKNAEVEGIDKSTPAVSYTEVVFSKNGKDGDDLLVERTSRPEVYTEEHEKLLGDAKTEWTLFVDGYGKDDMGRMYSKQCKILIGFVRFVGVFVTAVCAARPKAGLPLVALYRKISRLGYKSVAHYLIQTCRSDPDLEKNEKTDTDTQIVAKRSLAFLSEEAESEDIAAKAEKIESKNKNPEAEVNTDEKPTELLSSDNPVCNNVKLESDQGLKETNLQTEINEAENENSNNDNESEAQLELTNGECKVNNTDDEVKTVVLTPETKPGSRKKRAPIAIEGSIAGRLRSRRICT